MECLSVATSCMTNFSTNEQSGVPASSRHVTIPITPETAAAFFPFFPNGTSFFNRDLQGASALEVGPESFRFSYPVQGLTRTSVHYDTKQELREVSKKCATSGLNLATILDVPAPAWLGTRDVPGLRSLSAALFASPTDYFPPFARALRLAAGLPIPEVCVPLSATEIQKRPGPTVCRGGIR